MTAVAERARVPAGVPGGGRFAPEACRTAYLALDALAARAAEPPAGGNRILVPAPRCPHGSFARWAARNCCATDGLAIVGGQSALPCTGSRRDGSRCTRTTTLRAHGKPACHDHGGHQSAAA